MEMEVVEAAESEEAFSSSTFSTKGVWGLWEGEEEEEDEVENGEENVKHFGVADEPAKYALAMWRRWNAHDCCTSFLSILAARSFLCFNAEEEPQRKWGTSSSDYQETNTFAP